YVAENFGEKTEGLQAQLNIILVLAANPKQADETEERIEKLVEMAPSSQQAVTAARLRVQMYADRVPKKADEVQSSKQASELLEVIKETRSNEKLMAADQKLQKGSLASFMDAEETRIKIGVLASQEKSKDFGAAAKGY